jgi:hypothetical protein
MIPLLSILVLVAVTAPLGFLLLLRKTVRHVLVVSVLLHSVEARSCNRADGHDSTGDSCRHTVHALRYVVVGFHRVVRG